MDAQLGEVAARALAQALDRGDGELDGIEELGVVGLVVGGGERACFGACVGDDAGLGLRARGLVCARGLGSARAAGSASAAIAAAGASDSARRMRSRDSRDGGERIASDVFDRPQDGGDRASSDSAAVNVPVARRRRRARPRSRRRRRRRRR